MALRSWSALWLGYRQARRDRAAGGRHHQRRAVVDPGRSRRRPPVRGDLQLGLLRRVSAEDPRGLGGRPGHPRRSHRGAAGRCPARVALARARSCAASTSRRRAGDRARRSGAGGTSSTRKRSASRRTCRGSSTSRRSTGRRATRSSTTSTRRSSTSRSGTSRCSSCLVVWLRGPTARAAGRALLRLHRRVLDRPLPDRGHPTRQLLGRPLPGRAAGEPRGRAGGGRGSGLDAAPRPARGCLAASAPRALRSARSSSRRRLCVATIAV